MPKQKTDNIILRVDSKTHQVIKSKSHLFSRKKSDYLRHCALSYWEDVDKTHNFKKMLKLYQEGDIEEKCHIVEILFEYYRRTGFPHRELTDDQKLNRMIRLINTKNVLLEDDHLERNIVSLELANCFHPHMMTVPYNDKSSTPIQTYLDDARLKDCINRWMELGKTPNPSGVRRILKTRDGTRSVVNFKPAISKFIYDTYAPRDGRVLDPCSGYSGRLLGCIASNRGIKYHGIDPDGRTAVGNTQCASFFSQFYDTFGNREFDFGFRFDLGCAEDIMPHLGGDKYDLVFTSPPYFDTEQYSDNPNQSYRRYSNYKEWFEEFLLSIVDGSRHSLNSGGYLVLNIKNSSKYKIADDLVEACDKRSGWILEKTYHMRLANSEYHRRDGSDMYHTEPIFVFKKT